MSIGNTILVWLLVLFSTFARGEVFLHWTNTQFPPAKELGVNDLVLSWNDTLSTQVQAARAQGYRVYGEVPLGQAEAAAKTAASDLSGIILIVNHSESADIDKSLSKLRSAHPKIRFLVLDADGKQPQMRGSLVIKRGSVLEVSSPTAQPWIDTNLALVKIAQRSHQGQIPLYTFSWAAADPGQQPPALRAEDYSLAVAEGGALHASCVLDLDESLQKGLSEHDPHALNVWNQVLPYISFYSRSAERALEPASNVAVVLDDLDTSDETINLLARHNIPFEAMLPGDLQSRELQAFDVVVVFAKPDKPTGERLSYFATQGKTVVLVEPHGFFPWQNAHSIRLNEHTVSYAVGKGKVLELAEPVTDPETFAQDIRRLLGTQNVLMSLWNGLTTIAVPYRENGGTMKEMEFINYAEEPLRLQVQVKGSFASIRYESPAHPCCESLVPLKHGGFTEFVIPELRIAGRVHLEPDHAPNSEPSRK